MTPDQHRLKTAKLVSTVLGPVPMGVVLGLAVGIHSGRGLLAGAGWGLLSVVCAAVIPALATAPLRKRVARTPKVRLAYMTPAVVGALVGLVLLRFLTAPNDVRVLATGFAAGLVCSAAVNAFYNASNHVAALVGGAVLASALLSPWALIALLLVPIQARSREVLGKHSRPQASWGAVVGACAALAVVAVSAAIF